MSPKTRALIDEWLQDEKREAPPKGAKTIRQWAAELGFSVSGMSKLKDRFIAAGSWEEVGSFPVKMGATWRKAPHYRPKSKKK